MPTRYDGWTSLSAGANAGVPPVQVAANGVARAYNQVHRGGLPEQRPGFVRLDFDTSALSSPTLLDTAIFQRFHDYRSDDGQTTLIALIGGKLYEFDVEHPVQTGTGTAVKIEEITWDTTSATNRTLGWMWQAENVLIVQDGQSPAVFWDGGHARAARATEIRAGTCGAYIQGRNWYSLPDGKTFRATDLVYSDGTREAMLKETENDILNEGGDFVVPSDAGEIRCIVSPEMLDTSLGHGPVHVMCENKVVTVNAPIDRTIWKDLTYPIVTQSLVTNGAMSAASAVLVNGDVFYRAKDGIRSYKVARSDFNAWGNTPISGEVDYWLDTDSYSLLQYASGALFQNRALFTSTPSMTQYGVVHSSLVVVDFSPVATMRDKEPAEWDGIWTGLKIHQIHAARFATGDRCFMFTRNTSNELELWEIDPLALYDTGASEKSIVWGFESRGMQFGSQFNRKYLQGGRLWIEALSGSVEFDLKWKPDGYPSWYDWHSWTECATTDQCFSLGECLIVNRQKQYRAPMSLPKPPELCNTTNESPSPEFFVVQVKFTATGPARLTQAIFAADELLPKAFDCPGSTCTSLDVCPTDPLSYSSET